MRSEQSDLHSDAEIRLVELVAHMICSSYVFPLNSFEGHQKIPSNQILSSQGRKGIAIGHIEPDTGNIIGSPPLPVTMRGW